MKKILFAIWSIVLLSGCASETEQKALDRIASIYDAKATYTKGYSSSVGEETVRKFTVKVSESSMIDSLNPNITSANIALLVFQGMTPDEQDKYSQINVEMINREQDTASYTYPNEVMKKLYNKSINFDRFSRAIVEGDPETIDLMRDSDYMVRPFGNQLLQLLAKHKDAHGLLLDFAPFGIAEISDETGAAYQFQSNLVFNDGFKLPYIVVIDTRPGYDSVAGFRIFE